jgi:hypothetical protein
VEETLLKLWQFVNYETEIPEFEQWVYRSSELENKLPKDKNEVWKLRDLLRKWLVNLPPSCACVSWAEHQSLALGWKRPWTDEAWKDFDVVKERSHWLQLILCKGCGQHWYMFIDTDTDDYYLYRMKSEEVEAIEKDIWPRDIDAFNQHLDASWFEKRK